MRIPVIKSLSFVDEAEKPCLSVAPPRYNLLCKNRDLGLSVLRNITYNPPEFILIEYIEFGVVYVKVFLLFAPVRFTHNKVVFPPLGPNRPTNLPRLSLLIAHITVSVK